MYTLTFTLTAPTMRFSAQQTYNNKPTLPYPTKSSIVGLVAASLGRRRGENIDDLANMRMGVAVLNKPHTFIDFQTMGYANMTQTTRMPIQRKQYLSDCKFQIALESDNESLLESIARSFTNPAFPLFCGARDCIVTEPISGTINEGTIEDNIERGIETYIETNIGARYAPDTAIVYDQPANGREFRARCVKHTENDADDITAMVIDAQTE